MSHTAWSVKLSSTLVYGATSRWNSDDKRTREKAGRRGRDIFIAGHLALGFDDVWTRGWVMIPSTGLVGLVGWLVGGMGCAKWLTEQRGAIILASFNSVKEIGFS